MVVEDIIVNVKSLSELKGLVQARDDLAKLKKVGVQPVGKEMDKLNQRLKQNQVAVGKAGRVLGRFKFEMLGVLFFGMAVSRFLTGLLKPALEVTGAFEIMTFTLQDLFLPTAVGVSDVLLSIFDKISALPEPMQKLIGDMVLLNAGLFQLLSVLGQVALGLASVKIAFGLTGLATALILGKILLVIAAVEGLIILFKNWENISTDLKIVIGGLALVLGLIGLAIGTPFIAALGLISATVIGLIAIFKNWKEIVEATLRLLNRIPGVNLAIGAPADVIRASDEARVTEGRSIADAPRIGGGAFNAVTNITISQPLDETTVVDIAESIGNIVNDTISRGVGDLSRR